MKEDTEQKQRKSRAPLTCDAEVKIPALCGMGNKQLKLRELEVKTASKNKPGFLSRAGERN